MCANSVGEALKKTFIYQAILKAVEGVCDRTTVIVGIYRIDMVYEKPDLSLTLFYLDCRRTAHLAAYEGVSHYTGRGTEKKVTEVRDQYQPTEYIRQHVAFKLSLVALGYAITEPNNSAFLTE